MFYGECSNDYFLIYYGFVLDNNLYDDCVLFSNFEYAMVWYSVVYLELWDGFEGEICEKVVNVVYDEVMKVFEVEGLVDVKFVAAEFRLKVFGVGRIDARFFSVFVVMYVGIEVLGDINGLICGDEFKFVCVDIVV